MAVHEVQEIEPFSEETIRRVRTALTYFVFILLVAALPLSYLLGKRHGESAARSAILERQKDVLVSIMEDDKERFGKLYFEDGSEYVVVRGDVPLNADREMLEERVSVALGADMAEKVLRLVGMEGFQ